jgi:hypothetical protein
MHRSNALLEIAHSSPQVEMHFEDVLVHLKSIAGIEPSLKIKFIIASKLNGIAPIQFNLLLFNQSANHLRSISSVNKDSSWFCIKSCSTESCWNSGKQL